MISLTIFSFVAIAAALALMALAAHRASNGRLARVPAEVRRDRHRGKHGRG